MCFVFSGCLTVERSSYAAREAAKTPATMKDLTGEIP
jgi:hypothetical protein